MLLLLLYCCYVCCGTHLHAANISIETDELFASPIGGNAKLSFGKSYDVPALTDDGKGNKNESGNPVPPTPAVALSARRVPRRDVLSRARLFSPPTTGLEKPGHEKTPSLIAEDETVIDFLDAVRNRHRSTIVNLKAEKAKVEEENADYRAAIGNLSTQLDIAQYDIAKASEDNFALASALCLTTAEKEDAEAKAAKESARRDVVRTKLRQVTHRLTEQGDKALDRLISEITNFQEHQVAEAEAFVDRFARLIGELVALAGETTPAITKRVKFGI